MKAFFYRTYIISPFLLFFTACHSQVSRNKESQLDRPPAVAGTFYPADKIELWNMVSGFFNEAPSTVTNQPMAVIVPHAGYVFSGMVAAAAYRQIDRNRRFNHIFIIGSSHTLYFDGVSVYTRGDFITPLGKVKVDTLASWLCNRYKIISDDIKPHMEEHSLEVQLPFLQYWLRNSFSIVPIIIGGESKETSAKLAEALEPFFNEENLFIISTDFSHYPSYSNAIQSDTFMAQSIITNSSGKFLKAKIQDEQKGIPNLATALCGWTSVLTLLDMTEKRPDVTYKKILYRNSGDTEFGDKDRVVGYNSFCIVKSRPAAGYEFSLSREDKIKLLGIARQTISEYLRRNDTPEVKESALSPNLRMKTGAFVTLTKNKVLRGCVGNMKSDIPLYKLVQEMVIASATRDYRFLAVGVKELPETEIEISVLTPMKKINSIDEIVLGKHGIYIKKGDHTGTFLPQVADETHWTKEEFLGHCAQDKANIGWNGWKDAEIYTYEALVFSESEFSNELK